MSYQVPQHIDHNKIFITQFSEIEGRLDVDYYNPTIIEKIKKITNKSHLKLSEKIINLSTGFNNSQNEESGIKFFRTQNIRPIQLDLNNFSFTNDKRIRIPKIGSLLFTRIGVNVGDVAYNDLGDFAISDNVIAAEFEDILFSKFVSIYLWTELGNIFIEREKRDTARAIISYQNVKNIIVPKLSEETQQQIVSLYQESYKEKQQKEIEAQNLLDSIDGYLLSELGITLPDNSQPDLKDIPEWMNPENPLVKNGRLFLTDFCNIINQRLDPMPYNTNTKKLRQAIENCSYDLVPLNSIIIHSCAGDWGQDENEQVEDAVKCLVIRATEFDNKYNLDLENSRVKFRLIKQNKLARMDVQENDLLIEKSGGSQDQPVGRIAFLSKEFLNNNYPTICYSNFIHKIRIDSTKVNPEYIFYYLKTMHNIKLTETMQSQTNGIRNLIMKNYLNQSIPVPKIEKQNEITKIISDIYICAQQLENEATHILQQAKSEIEQMILGD